MLAHKLNHPVAGAVLAIALVAAISLVPWPKLPAKPRLAIKSDRLEQSDRSELGNSGTQAAWPYGRGWQLPPERRETKGHSLKRRQGLFWFLS
ncbi:hypothetical protein ABIF65_007926 [Bradyrhizobium japonicum]|uniref:Uncharacterized protein n=1 Tax=Bradyrhizobium barranii subsp. barranii TaxID=2823807 RepID=A0A939M4X7_9BRAD|nr:MULTISPECIES: hypothetical protein [Bradyrhizobium]MBR0882725.1 hypothetical protein [Bradyrhizobium liaoningense]MBR1003624.1 hypothetical protein [Bradyrhizobium liaoningense]MBR1069889.1 hypothetical protein [Bradyrhizobium liaoningense]MCP1773608.1 hypothetical protein [Bradyrhizobium japonicum]MCP1863869.1 hypothetical protein [Bradyrhizobium japonicum]